MGTVGEFSMSLFGVGEHQNYLIFVDFAVLQFSFALFLERDDNQSNENINKEEWKHNKVHDVKDGHLDSKILYRPLIIVGRGH